MKNKRLVPTNNKNIVKYKDRYYADYYVGNNHIIVDLTKGIIKINDIIFPSDKNLSSFAYRYAGINVGLKNLTIDTVRFLICIGAVDLGRRSKEDSINEFFVGFPFLNEIKSLIK